MQPDQHDGAAEPNWDAPLTLTMRYGNAAALVQAIGYANNAPEEAKAGAAELRSALDDQPLPTQPRAPQGGKG